jgi:hypothetical protein
LCFKKYAGDADLEGSTNYASGGSTKLCEREVYAIISGSAKCSVSEVQLSREVLENDKSCREKYRERLWEVQMFNFESAYST